MNLKTRSAVFETNSSSSHSLVLAEDFSNMVQPPLPEHVVHSGVFHIFPDEFGWEVDSHYDLDSKASYLYVDAMQRVYNDDEDTFDQNDEKFQNSNPHLKMIVDAFKEHAGVSVEFHKNDDKYHPFGYIDHQSFGLCKEVWDEGVNGVIRFLFSQDSYFETDNDNH